MQFCSVCLTRAARPALVLPRLLALDPPTRNASKNKVKKGRNIETDGGAVPLLSAKGRKGKAEHGLVGDLSLPGERFSLKTAEEEMQQVIEKLRGSLKSVVDRVGRVSTALLEPIRVDIGGSREPLMNLANASVKDAETLIVSIYDSTHMKAIDEALSNYKINLSPLRIDDSTLRLKISKPDEKIRQTIARDASAACENHRIRLRDVRHSGVRDIKKDQDDNVITKNEAQTESQKLEDLTKRYSAQIDKILKDANAIVLDK